MSPLTRTKGGEEKKNIFLNIYQITLVKKKKEKKKEGVGGGLAP